MRANYLLLLKMLERFLYSIKNHFVKSVIDLNGAAVLYSQTENNCVVHRDSSAPLVLKHINIDRGQRMGGAWRNVRQIVLLLSQKLSVRGFLSPGGCGEVPLTGGWLTGRVYSRPLQPPGHLILPVVSRDKGELPPSPELLVTGHFLARVNWTLRARHKPSSYLPAICLPI